MSTTKPDLSRIWASGANPADIIDPDVGEPGKYAAGWEAELPPYQYFNSVWKSFTEAFAHFNEQGIAVWDTDTVYPIGGLAKGSDGEIYKAILEQNGNDPVTDIGNNWKPLFDLATDNTLQKLYPVGEMLITLRSGNPNTWLGFGTWVRMAEGRTLVGYDGADSDFNLVEKEGGAKTHTLTESEMPSHSHTVSSKVGDGTFSLGSGDPSGSTNNPSTSSVGGGSAHNNLQPYLVTNIWKRTV